MSVTMMTFRVHTGPDTSHDLPILPADRMRAERMSTKVLPPSQRGPQAAKTHSETWVLLWLYVASIRLQLVDASVDFETWADTVWDYDRLDIDGNVVDHTPEAQAEAEDPAVDPTQRAELTTSP